jgi:hypothetical protein
VIGAVELQQLCRWQFTADPCALRRGPSLQHQREVPRRIAAGSVERGPVGEHLRGGIDHGIDHQRRGPHRRIIRMSAPHQHERIDPFGRHVADQPSGRIVAPDGAELRLGNAHAVYPEEIGLNGGSRGGISRQHRRGRRTLAQCGPNATVVVRSIQIDQPGYPRGIPAGKCRELISGNRVPHEGNLRESERVEHRAEIGDAGRQIISRWRLAGRAVAPAGDGEDMVLVGEAGGEFIESVRDVLQAGEEDEWWPRAAPVEHLESHSPRHRYELDSMGRRIDPRRNSVLRPRYGRGARREHAQAGCQNSAGRQPPHSAHRYRPLAGNCGR